MKGNQDVNGFIHKTWHTLIPHIIAYSFGKEILQREDISDKKKKMDRKKIDRIYWRR